MARYYYDDRHGYIRSRSYVEPTREPIVHDFVHIDQDGRQVSIEVIQPQRDVEELIVPQFMDVKDFYIGV